ncbi:MAG TPA: EAL domain-containing protein [Xanthomonadaceae bacterium]|nr:EAL domain-containing protein [Xanthomonadaceae bacterium]
MSRRERAMLGFTLVAVAGVLLVSVSVAWLLWRMSLAAEEARAGELARALGLRTEQILVDARATLERLDGLTVERCSAEHLVAMQDAAIARPHIRTIGHWRAAERLCGLGFVGPPGLRPARADRIYESGVIAWWPGPQTEVGGVRLFLMRYGDHDIAIDPGMLLETGPVRGAHAELWLEGLRLASTGENLDLPQPESLALGLTLDHANGRIVSRYSHASVLPIDIVAVEPIGRFWGRYLPAASIAAVLGLALIVGWVVALLRYSRRQMSPPTQLREALAANRIQVHYQPVVDLRTGACVGAEALARWEVEPGEWISPEVFIPMAERSGLIARITLSVLSTVLRDMGDMLRDSREFCVNLNLGSEDLLGNHFAQALSKRLEAAGVAPQRLKLEITERVLLNDDDTRARIVDLRRRGHAVIIDDFGTGYSSLSYLEKLELDALKIDKSFVDGIGTGAVTGGVIGHIIEMADSLGLGMVAEGIERAEQVDWLLQRDVRYGQGHFFGRPLSAEDFHAFVRAKGIAVAPRRTSGVEVLSV